MLLDFDECSTSNPVCDVNMQTVRIMSDRISVPVKQDLLVTGKTSTGKRVECNELARTVM